MSSIAANVELRMVALGLQLTLLDARLDVNARAGGNDQRVCADSETTVRCRACHAWIAT